MDKARLIREALLPKDDADLADMYNNYANLIFNEAQSRPNLVEAARLYQQALNIDMMQPVKERNEILHIRYLNIGTVYIYQRDWIKARHAIELGRQYNVEHFGHGSHFEAESLLFR